MAQLYSEDACSDSDTGDEEPPDARTFVAPRQIPRVVCTSSSSAAHLQQPAPRNTIPPQPHETHVDLTVESPVATRVQHSSQTASTISITPDKQSVTRGPAQKTDNKRAHLFSSPPAERTRKNRKPNHREWKLPSSGSEENLDEAEKLDDEEAESPQLDRAFGWKTTPALFTESQLFRMTQASTISGQTQETDYGPWPSSLERRADDGMENTSSGTASWLESANNINRHRDYAPDKRSEDNMRRMR